LPKSLVIVESPAKAKTINKYLGSDYEVEASLGHVKDLPKSKLGVDIEGDFSTEYVVIPGKEKVLAKLKKMAKTASAIYLAPDPDREGEAIAAHLADEFKEDIHRKKGGDILVRRVTFNEITKKAVQEAFKHARDVDQDLVDAQQTRRVLDRIVGYQVSPLLWDKVRRGLSAGRVQTVALRLIVEREREIKAFDRKEYWTIDADLAGSRTRATVVRRVNELTVFAFGGSHRLQFEAHDTIEEEDPSGGLVSPLPGAVIQVLIKDGEAVQKGQALMIIEAMKMEHTIAAPQSGTVKRIYFAAGEQVAEGAQLLEFEETTKA